MTQDALVLRPPVGCRLLLCAAPTALAAPPTVLLAAVSDRWASAAFAAFAAFALVVVGRTARVRCELRDGELLVVNRFRTRRFRAVEVEEYGSSGLLGVGPAGLSLRLVGTRLPVPFLVEATVSGGSRAGVSRTDCVLREARRAFRGARYVQPS